MIYEINGQTIDVIAIILTIITANVMLDWKLSGRNTLGGYFEYRRIPLCFIVVWLSISIITVTFISTAIISHAGLLGMGLENIFGMFGQNVQFKII